MKELFVYKIEFIGNLFCYMVGIIFLLLSIALVTIFERKFLASGQRRRGPEIVGIFGVLQAFADGLKVLTKEVILPQKVSVFLFLFSPIFSFFLTMCMWFVIPIVCSIETFEFPISVLLVMSLSGMSVLSNVFAGWSSNSKYSLMGGVRAASQLISYEMCLLLIMVSVCMLAGSVSLVEIIKRQEFVWYIFLLFPMFLVFFIIGLAETNRSPFDLAEAESELVAGYNVEYSSIVFVFFFLAEYGNLIVMSMLITCLFLGGGSCLPFFFFSQNSVCFALKCTVLIYFFLMARAVLPRFRYDDLMSLGWTRLFPFCFFNFVYVVVLRVSILNMINV